MEMTLAWWAALLGLALAIILILRKLNTTYALLLGAVFGCLIAVSYTHLRAHET